MDQRRPFEEPEVLDSRPGGPRRRGWIALAVVCSCLIVVGIAWRSGYQDRNSAETSRSPSSAGSADSTSEPDASVTAGAGSETRARPVPGVRTTHTADFSWLDVATDYSIFLRTVDGVVHVHSSADEVVRTSVPELVSNDGPPAFVPVDGAVLIRPFDFVPGYLVPDNATAWELPSTGGTLLPGPDDRHVWFGADGDLHLVPATSDIGSDGNESPGVRISLPNGGVLPVGDGHGYVLAMGGDQNPATWWVYRLKPGAAKTKLPIGRPIAIGPTLTLGTAAGCTSACPIIELDGNFTKLGVQPRWRVDADQWLIGTVSPDGKIAAVIGGAGVPQLVDLASGRRTPARRLKVTGQDQLAFSTDSRWLFGMGANHNAYAVDVRTGQTRRLLSDVTGVQQLAVRAG